MIDLGPVVEYAMYAFITLGFMAVACGIIVGTLKNVGDL